MGKGDKKTRRGKITAGTYGKLRPRKSNKTVIKPKKKTKPAASKSKATKTKKS